jgi:hypothetical protein
MKRKGSPAIVALVLAAFISMTGVAEAKKPRQWWARGGCGMLAMAYSGLHDERRTAIWVSNAVRQFERAGLAYRPTADDLSGREAILAWVVRVGALCKADFPNRRAVREAQFPTNLVT